MHEILVLFPGNTFHTPNMHRHSSLKEKQSKISRNQNLKPEKRKQNMESEISISFSIINVDDEQIKLLEFQKYTNGPK